jgi:hypothetical protein
MTVAYLRNAPETPRATFLLAHGAGAPMDTPFMAAFAEGLCALGFAVARFEFAYMEARRHGAGRKPPPRAERLMDEFGAAIAGLGAQRPLVIGGKSLGGRVASLIAQEAYRAGHVAGLVCLGYPFHPPGKPGNLRTAHLAELELPVLIVQGERDPFGTRDEVAEYKLPETITLHWTGDGDHSLVPRKRSGRTAAQNWQEAVGAIAVWASRAVAA